MAIFFITGTSGSGKSTIKELLQSKFCKESYVVYDFDENGVPANADASWRQKTTDYWLKKAYENSLKSKSTIICGVSVPLEIMNSVNKPDLPIYFGFLKIDDDVIISRLKQRSWNDQLIQDNINWAHYLEAEVNKHKDHLIIDCSAITPEEITKQIIVWIESYN